MREMGHVLHWKQKSGRSGCKKKMPFVGRAFSFYLLSLYYLLLSLIVLMILPVEVSILTR